MEVAARQQFRMPAADQRRLDRASLDAMTQAASSELCNAWDALSRNLSAVERNVTAALEDELGETEARLVERIRDTSAKLRRDFINPRRQVLNEELARLRSMQTEREQLRAGSISPGRAARLQGRDGWWESVLASEANTGMVRLAEITGGALFVLLVAGLALFATELDDQQAVATAWSVWSTSFACVLGVNIFTLGRLILYQPPRDTSRRDES